MAVINQEVKCPQCSAGMVLRTASKGAFKGRQFYGCSRYPRCKGIRNDAIPAKQSNEVQDSRPSSNASVATVLKESPKPSTPLTEFQKKELLRLRDRLLNVSSLNRSIRLNRLNKKNAFDLSMLNVFDPTIPNRLIEHCLSSDSDFRLLPPKTNENEEDWNRISGHLTHLYRNITEIQREKGLYDLYIGLPFLTGRPQGTEAIIQAPLFLLPVHLEKIIPEKGASNWAIKPNPDVKAFFNKTLFFALAKLCKLSVSTDLFEEAVPQELYGDTHFVTWMQKLLLQYGVPAKIHEEALDEVFDRVQEFSIKELTPNLRLDGLEIRQYAVLGHFPQSNSSLQRDYDELILQDQESLDGITCFLSEEYLNADQEYDESLASGNFEFSETDAKETSTIDERPERENFLLLPSDSSQDRIILELSKKSTDGLVVWGPPGTGKSQTIVNIIGDSIARGKTVLLVSQKRAALDVVYERLAGQEMDSFVALVHDTKEDRKDLFRKVSQICGQVQSEQKSVSDPSPEIDRITQTLKDVSNAYNDSKYGISFGRIMQGLAGSKGPILSNLGHFWKTIDLRKLDGLCQSIESFQSLRYPIIDKETDAKRKSFEGILEETAQQSIRIINELIVSKHFKGSVYISRAVTGQVPEFDPEGDAVNFKSEVLELNSQTSFGRYFRPSFWKLKAKIHERIRTALSNLESQKKIALKVLSQFFDASFVSSNLNFVDAPKQTYLFLETISTILCNYFESFKSIDVFRKTLPAEILDVESELRNLEMQNASVRWHDVLRASVYTVWEKDLEEKHQVISLIRSGQVDSLRFRLKELLDHKIDYSIDCLRQRLRSELSSPNGLDLSRSLGSVVNRKRNIPTVRKLNEEFIGSNLFRKMLPVWLVSPETVSDVFPLKKDLFDVVIFDEASQCNVENGLPAVYRGKQVVIAGDEKQLPPNRLFETEVGDEDDDESFAAIEPSLLTLAKKTLRYKPAMLEWHYRSKFQELVSFSNEAFYSGRMKIAPNVIPFIKGNTPAITWHSVQGYWEDRTNRQEAQKVIEFIKYYYKSESPKSLGVITFNTNQKNLILDLIDSAIVADPEFAAMMERDQLRALDQQLFVKNIENVQGDERQIIIFSVAYAPEHPGGRVQQRFGLLNKPGGENRLNVAVTRAIEEIHVVCSINPEIDLNTSTSAHAGPRILRNYLCYAKSVWEQNFTRIEAIFKELNPNLAVRSHGALVFDSPFEEDVYRELADRGYEVHSQVGQSGFRIDLAVVSPKDKGRYLLGIECDGAMFHSAISVRERDVFRQRFLEARGWKISRVWSPSWRKNRNGEIRKLIDAIESAAKENSSTPQSIVKFEPILTQTKATTAPVSRPVAIVRAVVEKHTTKDHMAGTHPDIKQFLEMGPGEVSIDQLAEALTKYGYEVIDKRKTGGSLWVVDKPGFGEVLKFLTSKGIKFEYTRNGSRSTRNRPAWYVKQSGSGGNSSVS